MKISWNMETRGNWQIFVSSRISVNALHTAWVTREPPTDTLAQLCHMGPLCINCKCSGLPSKGFRGWLSKTSKRELMSWKTYLLVIASQLPTEFLHNINHSLKLEESKQEFSISNFLTQSSELYFCNRFLGQAPEQNGLNRHMGQATTFIRMPGIKSHLFLWSRFLVTPSKGNRSWFNYLPCTQETRWSLWLLLWPGSDPAVASVWEVKHQMEALSRFSLSFLLRVYVWYKWKSFLKIKCRCRHTPRNSNSLSRGRAYVINNPCGNSDANNLPILENTDYRQLEAGW